MATPNQLNSRSENFLSGSIRRGPRALVIIGLIITLSLWANQPLAASAEDGLHVCIAKIGGKITAQDSCPTTTTRLREKSYSEGRRNILYVAKKGAAFKSINAAITKASALNPTATSPITIRVAPGVFSLNETIIIPSNVSIVGSGRGISVIESNAAQPIFLGSANSIKNLSFNWEPQSISNLMINGSNLNGVILEDLDIEVIVSNAAAITIYLENVSGNIRNVNISGSGPQLEGLAIRGANSNMRVDTVNIDVTSGGGFVLTVDTGAQAKLTNLSIDLSVSEDAGSVPSALRIGDTGTNFVGSNIESIVTSNGPTICSNLFVTATTDVTISHSKLSCSGSTTGTVVVSEGGEVDISHSVITGDAGAGLIASNGTSIVRMTHSQLNGGSTSGIGTITCAGVTDEALAFYQTTCP